MIHHVSVNARAPEPCAHAIATLVGARAFRAPSPPFPRGAWLVCWNDESGTMLEILLWAQVRHPGAPGFEADDAMRPHTGTHLLVGTTLREDAVAAIATREGWHTEPGSAGLFHFTKVWIENALLLELVTPEQLRDYVAVFGTAGRTTLAGTLRRLESELEAAIGAAR